MQGPPDLDEQVIGSNSLIPAGAEASKVLDTFASWLIGGFGATLAFLISSKEAHAWMSADALPKAGKVFWIALALTVVQKYLAALLASIAAGQASARKAVEDQRVLRGEHFKFEPQAFFAQMRSALPGMSVILGGFFVRAVADGDLMVAARWAMRLLYSQGLCVLGVATLLLKAAWVIAWR